MNKQNDNGSKDEYSDPLIINSLRFQKVNLL